MLDTNTHVLLMVARAGRIASVMSRSQWCGKNCELWLLMKHIITFRTKSKIPNMTFKVIHNMVPVYLCIYIFSISSFYFIVTLN